MTKRPNTPGLSTYATLSVLNGGVALMFIALLASVAPLPRTVFAAPPLSNSREVQTVQTTALVGTPVRVKVPSVAIDESVRTGSYNPQDDTWVIEDDAAFHADTTVPVNNANGTTLIYGHATLEVFGRLPEVAPQAEAVVYSQEGYEFRYVYEWSRQVSPQDVSALTAAGPPRLLLQTCSGPFDVYRTLVSFRLVGVTYGA